MPLLCIYGKRKSKQLTDLESRQSPEDINVTKSIKGLYSSIKIETKSMPCLKRQRRSTITWSGQFREREHKGNCNTFIKNEWITLNEWFILLFLFVNCPCPTVIIPLPFLLPEIPIKTVQEVTHALQTAHKQFIARMQYMTLKNQLVWTGCGRFPCPPWKRITLQMTYPCTAKSHVYKSERSN